MPTMNSGFVHFFCALSGGGGWVGRGGGGQVRDCYGPPVHNQAPHPLGPAGFQPPLVQREQGGGSSCAHGKITDRRRTTRTLVLVGGGHRQHMSQRDRWRGPWLAVSLTTHRCRSTPLRVPPIALAPFPLKTQSKPLLGLGMLRPPQVRVSWARSGRMICCWAQLHRCVGPKDTSRQVPGVDSGHHNLNGVGVASSLLPEGCVCAYSHGGSSVPLSCHLQTANLSSLMLTLVMQPHPIDCELVVNALPMVTQPYPVLPFLQDVVGQPRHYRICPIYIGFNMLHYPPFGFAATACPCVSLHMQRPVVSVGDPRQFDANQHQVSNVLFGGVGCFCPC